MSNMILVFLGGGLGSLLRHALSQQYNQSLAAFSLGTFLANILSCFILGLLLSLRVDDKITNNYYLLLGTGFCGGFSTFSTFSGELFLLNQEKGIEQTLIYLLASITSGLLMIYLGYKTGNSL